MLVFQQCDCPWVWQAGKRPHDRAVFRIVLFFLCKCNAYHDRILLMAYKRPGRIAGSFVCLSKKYIFSKACHSEEQSDVGIRISNVWKYHKYPVKKQHFRERIATPVCALVRNDIVFRQSHKRPGRMLCRVILCRSVTGRTVPVCRT